MDRNEPPIAVCSIVAVAIGHRGHGHARELKRLVIDRARASGAVAVVSEVHQDNDAMLQLNISLGANVERLDESDYLTCIIPLE